MLEACDLKDEMKNVCQHFCSVVGNDLRELHAPSSKQRTSLEEYISEILTIAEAMKDDEKV